MAVKFKEKCKKCFHFQVCANVLQNDLFIREVMLGEKEPGCKQFVEVVRCKDCEFCSYNSSNDTCKCKSMNGMYRTVKPDDFCSYGERR